MHIANNGALQAINVTTVSEVHYVRNYCFAVMYFKFISYIIYRVHLVLSKLARLAVKTKNVCNVCRKITQMTFLEYETGSILQLFSKLVWSKFAYRFGHNIYTQKNTTLAKFCCTTIHTVRYFNYSARRPSFNGVRPCVRGRDGKELIQCPTISCDGMGHVSGNYATHRRQAIFKN